MFRIFPPRVSALVHKTGYANWINLFVCNKRFQFTVLYHICTLHLPENPSHNHYLEKIRLPTQVCSTQLRSSAWTLDLAGATLKFLLVESYDKPHHHFWNTL